VIFAPLSTEGLNWMRERSPTIHCEDMVGIEVRRDGVIQAVAITDTFSRDGCNVHWVIENPMAIRHGLIQAVCNYCFNERGRARIFGPVPAWNTKSLKLCEHVGMTEVARIPHGCAEGVDYVIMAMTRAECRWLPEVQEEAA
jgi:RimJ/RimL family protein N-acetyltransferase